MMRSLSPALLGMLALSLACSSPDKGVDEQADPVDNPDDGSPDDGSPDDGTPAPELDAVTEVFQTSRAGDKLTSKGALSAHAAGRKAGAQITVFPDKKRQRILGFGGALTESSASVLATLPAAKRKEVIDAYFSRAGAGYTLARTHIASCDFSVASYQYSTLADPELSDFSITHDQAELIPLIQDAIAAADGDLKVIAAPWSAPAWMKSPAELFVKPSAANGYRGVDPALKAENYGAYALYLTKYLEAYAAEGIPIWGLSPQNEPLGNGGNWETMRWSAADMGVFIRDHLGPLLEAKQLDTKLMVYDHNKGDVTADAVYWARALYGDPEVSKYIWGFATHWYASTVKVFEKSLDAIHELAPDKPILATEHTIDGLSDRKALPPSPAYDGSWLGDEFYWTKSAYDWGYWWATGSARALHPVYEPVNRYARDIIVGLNHWYTGWIDWNVVLDETGGPNHQNNLCAAPVMVDRTSHEVTYTPLFYVLGHFSKYIRPDAQVLDSKVALAKDTSLEGYDGEPTEGLLATASLNADGSYAVVLFNQTAAPLDYTLTVGDTSADGRIDAQALITVLWKP